MPVKRLCFDFLHAGALVGNMDMEEQRRAKPFEFCFYRDSTTLGEAVGFV